MTADNVSGTLGLPSWASGLAFAMTGNNYLDFGTQTFGGTFSIAVLVRKAALPAGNSPVYDFNAAGDGLTLFYQRNLLGPVFGYYDGRTYMSYVSDTATVGPGEWDHDVFVFEEVANNASLCSAAGAPVGMTSCTTISAYRNGQLITAYGPSMGGGFAGLNPVVKGLVGGQYAPVAKVARSGLYVGKSNWPQSGFNGHLSEFQFFQDVALSAATVRRLYAGSLLVC